MRVLLCYKFLVVAALAHLGTAQYARPTFDDDDDFGVAVPETKIPDAKTQSLVAEESLILLRRTRRNVDTPEEPYEEVPYEPTSTTPEPKKADDKSFSFIRIGGYGFDNGEIPKTFELTPAKEMLPELVPAGVRVRTPSGVVISVRGRPGLYGIHPTPPPDASHKKRPPPPKPEIKYLVDNKISPKLQTAHRPSLNKNEGEQRPNIERTKSRSDTGSNKAGTFDTRTKEAFQQSPAVPQTVRRRRKKTNSVKFGESPKEPTDREVFNGYKSQTSPTLSSAYADQPLRAKTRSNSEESSLYSNGKTPLYTVNQRKTQPRRKTLSPRIYPTSPSQGSSQYENVQQTPDLTAQQENSPTTGSLPDSQVQQQYSDDTVNNNDEYNRSRDIPQYRDAFDLKQIPINPDDGVSPKKQYIQDESFASPVPKRKQHIAPLPKVKANDEEFQYRQERLEVISPDNIHVPRRHENVELALNDRAEQLEENSKPAFSPEKNRNFPSEIVYLRRNVQSEGRRNEESIGDYAGTINNQPTSSIEPISKSRPLTSDRKYRKKLQRTNDGRDGAQRIKQFTFEEERTQDEHNNEQPVPTRPKVIRNGNTENSQVTSLDYNEQVYNDNVHEKKEVTADVPLSGAVNVYVGAIDEGPYNFQQNYTHSHGFSVFKLGVAPQRTRSSSQ